MARVELLSPRDLYETYADARDELEDAIRSLSQVREDVMDALDELSEELDSIQEHLLACGRSLKWYSCRQGIEASKTLNRVSDSSRSMAQ